MERTFINKNAINDSIHSLLRPSLLLMLLVVMIMTNVIVFINTYRTEKSEIISRSNSLIDAIKGSLVNSLETGDYPEIERLLGGIARNNKAESLYVIDSNGYVEYSFPAKKWMFNKLNDNPLASQLHIGKEQNLQNSFFSYNGQLVVFNVIKDNLAKDQRYLLINYAINNIRYGIIKKLISLSLIVFMLILLSYLLIDRIMLSKLKPLSEIMKQIREISCGNYESSNIPASPKSRLFNLVNEFNKMKKDIKMYEESSVRNASLVTIGQSASMIAHDVRKPLTSLKSLTMLLSEKYDDPEFIQDFSKKVEDSIDKTNSMLNEILEFSKDATSLEKRNCDPQSIVTSALSDVFTGKPDISVEVEYLLKHKNYLNVDCHRIVRVITNIIGNAVEAMNGNGKIWIATEDVGDTYMKVVLGNNGPVIPEDVQKRLFDPFFTKGKKGGTGLGLAICQKIIEMHGGTVKVESDNDGTEFIIELPTSEGNLTVNEAELIHHSNELKKFIEEEKAREQYGESENKAEFMRLHKEHGTPFYMLVVDDEPLFRETIRGLINGITQVRDHVKVIEADSAEMALTLFGERKSDYVIADIDMGHDRMNGYELVKLILAKYPDTKVLLHSNKRREDCDREIREIASPSRNGTHFMGFMPKPMKQGELLQFLAQKTFESKAVATAVAKKKILILNDDDMLLLSFKLLLKSPEIQVLSATNISDALEHMSSNEVDVVLSDINLGDNMADGYDFLKEVKSKYSNIPVYMVSGYSESEEAPKAKKHGATGYFQLPVEKWQLLALLN